MNIFLLSEKQCPEESAIFQCDLHCKKMCIEEVQLLTNLFPEEKLIYAPKTQKRTVRKHSHKNHPCDKWTKESRNNVEWLIEHTRALFREYTFRYNKRHFTEDMLDWIEKNLDYDSLSNAGLTKFPIAINENMNCRKVIGFNNLQRFQQYRLYYRLDKPFSKWERGRNKPEWMN